MASRVTTYIHGKHVPGRSLLHGRHPEKEVGLLTDVYALAKASVIAGKEQVKKKI